MTDENTSVDTGNVKEVATEETWTSGFSEDTQAFISNKGWGDAGSVIKSYQNLEQLYGADKAGNTAIIPNTGMDETTLAESYNRLGRPVEAKGYELEEPEGADSRMTDWARNAFHKHGLSADAAKNLYNDFNDFNSETMKALETSKQQDFNQREESLKKEWGAAYDKNVGIASTAAKAFGLPDDTLDKLGESLGYDTAMRFFADIGKKIGEDDYITGNPNTNVMTPEQARQEMNGLHNDKAWTDAWMDNMHPGHKAALERKQRLSKLAAGGL